MRASPVKDDGRVTIITNSNDLTDIQKPAKGKSNGDVEHEERLRMEAEVLLCIYAAHVWLDLRWACMC